jgi:nodulation protein E
VDRRVVVTGWGVVSSIGQTAASFWSNLAAGVCGIAETTLVPADQLTHKRVAEVKGFDPCRHFDERQVTMLDRVSQLAVVAAREAIAQSGIVIDEVLSERTATIIGTGVGGQTTQDESYRRLYRDNAKRLHPLTIPKLMVNAPASQISMLCGLRGPCYAIASACASGTHAIGAAFQLVRSGGAACAVTGGADACITLGTMKGWEAMRVMAPDDCRPFSRDRKGLILGEGAAMVVLESLEHARARSAVVLGEIVGFGMSADAHDLTAPDENGMYRAMVGALADARLAPADIQHVNAHGTGTVANDAAETSVIKRVFGPQAAALAVSANKSMLGHALGAAGALELVATLMAIREGIAPPTVNYLGPDPVCDLDYVPNEARALRIEAALSSSFAFVGLNAVLAVRRAP